MSYDVPAPNPVVIGARNCTFKYGGGIISTTLGDGARIDNLNGLACFIDCEANSNYKDGFNIHNTTNSGKYKTYMMTINCRGLNNGRGVSTSNNGLTGHENARIFDYNGFYDYNYGGSVHHIGDTDAWMVKTHCQRSQEMGSVYRRQNLSSQIMQKCGWIALLHPQDCRWCLCLSRPHRNF